MPAKSAYNSVVSAIASSTSFPVPPQLSAIYAIMMIRLFFPLILASLPAAHGEKQADPVLTSSEPRVPEDTNGTFSVEPTAPNVTSVNCTDGERNMTAAGEMSAIGMPCLRDSDCLAGLNLVCINATGECACGGNTPIMLNDGGRVYCAPARALRDICTNDQECEYKTTGARCLNFHCDCPPNFVAQENIKCTPSARPWFPRGMALGIAVGVLMSLVALVIMTYQGVRKRRTENRNTDIKSRRTSEDDARYQRFVECMRTGRTPGTSTTLTCPTAKTHRISNTMNDVDVGSLGDPFQSSSESRRQPRRYLPCHELSRESRRVHKRLPSQEKPKWKDGLLTLRRTCTPDPLHLLPSREELIIRAEPQLPEVESMSSVEWGRWVREKQTESAGARYRPSPCGGEIRPTSSPHVSFNEQISASANADVAAAPCTTRSGSDGAKSTKQVSNTTAAGEQADREISGRSQHSTRQIRAASSPFTSTSSADRRHKEQFCQPRYSPTPDEYSEVINPVCRACYRSGAYVPFSKNRMNEQQPGTGSASFESFPENLWLELMRADLRHPLDPFTRNAVASLGTCGLRQENDIEQNDVSKDLPIPFSTESNDNMSSKGDKYRLSRSQPGEENALRDSEAGTSDELDLRSENRHDPQNAVLHSESTAQTLEPGRRIEKDSQGQSLLDEIVHVHAQDISGGRARKDMVSFAKGSQRLQSSECGSVLRSRKVRSRTKALVPFTDSELRVRPARRYRSDPQRGAEVQKVSTHYSDSFAPPDGISDTSTEPSVSVQSSHSVRPPAIGTSGPFAFSTDSSQRTTVWDLYAVRCYSPTVGREFRRQYRKTRNMTSLTQWADLLGYEHYASDYNKPGDRPGTLVPNRFNPEQCTGTPTGNQYSENRTDNTARLNGSAVTASSSPFLSRTESSPAFRTEVRHRWNDDVVDSKAAAPITSPYADYTFLGHYRSVRADSRRGPRDSLDITNEKM